MSETTDLDSFFIIDLKISLCSRSVLGLLLLVRFFFVVGFFLLCALFVCGLLVVPLLVLLLGCWFAHLLVLLFGMRDLKMRLRSGG